MMADLDWHGRRGRPGLVKGREFSDNQSTTHLDMLVEGGANRVVDAGA
jgi:hypothetical protein